ncbi:unnamed protein product, partial [marine sediment metagenome]
QALLSSKQYDEAVTILQNAIELNPQAEYKSLFSTALSEQKEYHRNEYGRIFPSAEARFAKRDWSEAYQKYKKALKHMETDEAKSKMEFCDLTKNAEKNFDSSPSLALNYLKKAYGKGYHKDYVKEKIRLLTPVDVSITFHNAVVLPIDYNTGKTWDGILGKVYEVSEFLGGKVLSKIGPQAAIAMFAVTEMTKMFTSTLVLPDCYMKINYKGSIYKSKFFLFFVFIIFLIHKYDTFYIFLCYPKIFCESIKEYSTAQSIFGVTVIWPYRKQYCSAWVFISYSSYS